MIVKVLHTEWSDGWGGQEIRIIQEMIAIREMGVEVFLACRKESVIYKKSLENNIQTFDLPFRGNLDLITMIKLIGIIKKNKINIVNTHSGKDTWVGGFAAKISKAKFIRTRHLSNPIKKSFFNFINRLADHVITTGEKIKKDMIENNNIIPQKIISIPTGPDQEIFDPKKLSKLESRSIFSIRNKEIAIGMLAVLRKFKRHDLFLNMAKKIIETCTEYNFKFLIAGDGPQRENIENLIQDLGIKKNVKLLGHIDNQSNFLNALDLFVICSDSGEGVPQSLMQALMMDLEIISSDAGSIVDLYNNENFKIIRSGNQEELNDSVIDFVKRASNGFPKKNTRQYMIQNFSKEQMTHKTLEVYKNLLG